MNRSLCVFLAFALVSTPSRKAEACGPFFESPVFAHHTHPDRPYTMFAAGQLGVLRPSFEPMYLAFAYRVMNGIPTTAEEQSALVKSWNREDGVEPTVMAEAEVWLAARNKFGAASDAGVDPYSESDYGRYQRINGDALTRAASSAELLSKSWKPDLVARWISAQELVFSTCESKLPFEPLEVGTQASLPAREVTRWSDERAYQQAARSFYCEDYDSAVRDFEAISVSKTSRWRPWGRVVAARALIRQHLSTSVGEAALADPAFAAWYERAKKLLEAVVKDRSAAEAHAAARRLLGYLKFRVEPKSRRCELFARVLERRSGSALESELVDLNLLFNDDLTACAKASGQAADLQKWMVTVGERMNASPHEREKDFPEAFAQWRKGRAPHWLVAALMKANSRSPDVAELIGAVQKIAPDSPAFPTVAAWTAHLLRDLGRAEEARALLERVPALPEAQLASRNILASEKMKLAKTLAEVAALATRVPAGADDGDGFSDAVGTPVAERLRLFDSDARSALSPRFTAARLFEFSQSPSLPKAQRRQTLWTAFTRAAIVSDDDTLKAAGRALADFEPTAKQELVRMLARTTAEDRRFDALLLIMGLPVATPILEPGVDVHWDAPTLSLIEDQSWRRNWWCTPESQAVEIVSWPFISDHEARKADGEWQAIIRGGHATKFFSNVALEWARTHPEDPRLPVALYRAVRTSKRGCGGGTTEATAAFRLLHMKYGNTEWAKKAKYVY